MKLTGNWSGYTELERDLMSLSKGMQGQALRGAMRAAATPIANGVRTASPSKRMKKSIVVQVSGRGPIAVAKIGAKKSSWGGRVLHLLEDGVAPHIIRVKDKKVLASAKITKTKKFVIFHVGGVFGTVVNHPGTRGRRFFRPALPRHAAEGERRFAHALRRIVDDMRLRMLRQQGGGG